MKTTLPELTLRGCIIAALITIVFTAANVYLGLKVGMTFSSSIPAAVISMSVLRFFSNSNIRENCTVQTFASAASTLAGLVFIIPSLIMLGYWVQIPYWETVGVCISGGILGIMFSIPLRRALVVESGLPYPEGVAAAQILAVGNTDSDSAINTGAKAIWHGGLLSGLFALFSMGFRLLSESCNAFFIVGGTVAGFATQYSLALLGAGYLIGIRIAISIFIGVVLTWGIALPYLAGQLGLPSDGQLTNFVYSLWASKVRYIGVGIIATASIWTIIALMPALYQGIASSVRDARKHKHLDKHNVLPRTDRDIPIHYVLAMATLCLLPICWLFYNFIAQSGLPLSDATILLIALFCTVFVAGLGFIIASVSGYMAGIAGSSNSPISGIAVIAVIVSVLLISGFFKPLTHIHISPTAERFMMALGIFIATLVVTVACISNDNLQDLKTGQLVKATPWRQQVALIMGVVIGALVIPSVLTLVYKAYGFVGAPLPRMGMDPNAALSAPQAVLMTELARGTVTHHNEWGLLAIGSSIGVVLILFDTLCLRLCNWPRLSVLSVGLGAYLPIQIIVPLIIGGVVSHLVKRRLRHQHGEQHKLTHYKLQRGTLFASGLIVGETLFGVILAGLITFTNDSHPLSLASPGFAGIANVLGTAAFILICIGFYQYIHRMRVKH